MTIDTRVGGSLIHVVCENVLTSLRLANKSDPQCNVLLDQSEN